MSSTPTSLDFQMSKTPAIVNNGRLFSSEIEIKKYKKLEK